jgi:hypothetical protein
MMHKQPHLQHELEYQVQLRTGRQIRNLVVELKPEKVILRGRASSYYAKQLAQHGIRDVLPHVRLENAITVDNGAAVLAG